MKASRTEIDCQGKQPMPLEQSNREIDDLKATINNELNLLKAKIDNARDRNAGEADEFKIDSVIGQLYVSLTGVHPFSFGNPRHQHFQELLQQLDGMQTTFNTYLEQKQTNHVEYPGEQLFWRLMKRTLLKFNSFFYVNEQQQSDIMDFIFNIKEVFTKRKMLFDSLSFSTLSMLNENSLLNYEILLAEREKNFNETSMIRRNLDYLTAKYFEPLTGYLQRCVELHSKMPVDGFHMDIDGLFIQIFGQQNISFSTEQRSTFKQQISNVSIPLIWPPLDVVLSESYNQLDTQTKKPLLPSKMVSDSRKRWGDSFASEMQKDPWIVLLGHPGSGKTTCARYLTCEYAQAILRNQKSIHIHGVDVGCPRVPVLIRVAEFAEWYQRNREMEFLDYFGKHTWFDRSYCFNADECNMLKEFVCNGHALIIFDGLEEIATNELRANIQDLINKFIISHTLTTDFVSPIDDPKLAHCGLERQFRTRNCYTENNFVIITSRATGYDFQPLKGSHVTHCKILPLTDECRRSLMETWCSHVREQILGIFYRLEPKLKDQIAINPHWCKAECLWTKIESENESFQSMASDVCRLSIICALYVQNGPSYLEKKRIIWCRDMIKTTLQKHILQHEDISTEIIITLLSALASYINSHSPSGLIDGFDLTQFCYYVLQNFKHHNKNVQNWSKSETVVFVNRFIQIMNEEDLGIFVSKSLNVYGFHHLLFQEYFVSLNLLPNEFNGEFDIERLLSSANPRMHEPRRLAISRISVDWNFEQFDRWCSHLISKTTKVNRYIPHGSLFLLNALNDIVCLPSADAVHKALDNLLNINGFNETVCLFQSRLSVALEQLPAELVDRWLETTLSRSKSCRHKILRLLHDYVAKHKKLCPWVTSKFCQTLSIQFEQNDNYLDRITDQVLTIIGVFDPSLLPGQLRDYQDLLSSHILTKLMNRSILTIIIALHGGLKRENIKQVESDNGLSSLQKTQTTMIYFSPHHMHKSSPLSELLIQYLFNVDENDELLQSQHLIDQCKDIIQTAEKQATSPNVVHSFVVLLCIFGVSKPHMFQAYADYPAFERAIQHIHFLMEYIEEFVSHIRKENFNMHFKSIVSLCTSEQERQIDELLCNYVSALAYSRLISVQNPHKESWTQTWKKDDILEENCLLNLKITHPIEPELFIQMEMPLIAKYLPFFYYIVPVPSTSGSVINETTLLESDDLELLSDGRHPFQLLAEHNFLSLLIAYIPEPLQPLYVLLIEKRYLSSRDESPIPLIHLLTLFLETAENWDTSSIRFNVILTLILPIIQKYGLQHYIFRHLAHAALIGRFTNVYFDKLCEDTVFKPFADLTLSVGSMPDDIYLVINNVIEVEECCIESLLTSNEYYNDNELYSASICLARLVIDDCYNIGEAKRNYFVAKAWKAAETIQDPLLKLDALIAICHISHSIWLNNVLDDRLYAIKRMLEQLLMLAPFHCFIIVFIRYLHLKCSVPQLDLDVFETVWQMMSELPDDEQQAVCQAFHHFSFIRSDVRQRIQLLEWSKDNLAISKVCDLRSTMFSIFSDNNALMLSDSSNMGSTLVACAYLKELYFDLALFKDWFISNGNRHAAFVVNSPVASYVIDQHHSIVETAQQNYQRLDNETASKICTFLHTNDASENEENLAIVEEQLLTFVGIKDNDTLSIVTDWLRYRNDPVWSSIALKAALLLAQSDMWTSEVLDMCCAALCTKSDEMREIASRCIQQRHWTHMKESVYIFIEWISKWNIDSRKATSVYAQTQLTNMIPVEEVQEIEIILQKERNAFEASLSSNTEHFHCSFLSLISTISDNVFSSFSEYLRSLSHSHDNNDGLFLSWIFKRLPHELYANCNQLLDSLLDIVQHEQTVKIALVATIKILCHWHNDERMRSALWRIINNSSENIEDEKIIVACLQSLYCKHGKRTEGIELDRLYDLRKYSQSSLVRRTALCGLYHQVVEQPEQYTIDEVYFTYMTHTTDSYLSDPSNMLPTIQWITRHKEHLISTLIYDMFNSMTSVDETIIKADLCGKLLEFMLNTSKIDSDMIHFTVQKSSFGKERFMNALYESSKRATSYRRLQYLRVYSCFQEVTDDFVCMLMTVAIEKTTNPLIDLSIKQIQSVQSREIVDNLIEMTTSRSYIIHSCSAALIVRLAQIDQISAIDAHETLTKCMERFDMVPKIHSNKQRQLNRDLMKLLCRLFSETLENEIERYFDDSNLMNSYNSIKWKVPTIIS